MGTTRIKSRVSLSRKRIRKRVIRSFKTRFKMSGGPISQALLSTPGTLVFSMGQWRGFYDAENKWVEL